MSHYKRKGPFKPFKPFQGKDHIPHLEPDDAVITDLFSIAREGDFSQIQGYINEHNLSFKVFDRSGKSLLHIILGDDNEIQRDKKEELSMQLIEKGVPVSKKDTNNTTILHLASKHQLFNVVKMILSYGGDPNAFDNQRKTPLHYFVQGENVSCKVPKPIGNLISVDDKPERLFVKQLKRLSSQIVEICQKTEFQRFFSHIYDTISHYDEYEPMYYLQSKNKFRKRLSDIVSSSGSTSGNKQKLLIDELQTERKQQIEHVNDKLKKVLSEIDIKPDQPLDGWGPGEMRIVPGPTTLYKINELSSLVNKQNNEINVKLNVSLNSIRDSFTKMVRSSDVIDAKLDGIRYLVQGYKHNTYDFANGMYIAPGIPIGNNILDHLMDGLSLIHDNLHGPGVGYVGAGAVGGNEIQFEMLEIDQSDIAQRFANININNRGFYIHSINPPLVYRGTKSTREVWVQNNMNIERLPITDEGSRSRAGNALGPNYGSFVGPNMGAMQANINARIILPPPGFVGLPNPGYAQNVNVLPIPQNDRNLYTYKLKFALTRIQFHMKILTENMRVMMQHIQSGFYYHIYNELLSTMLITILNISQYLSFIMKEKQYVLQKTQSLKTAFEQVFIPNEPQPYSFYLEHGVDFCEEIIKSLNVIFESSDELYSQFRTQIMNFNEVVDLLNNFSASNIINGFHSRHMGQNDTDYINDTFVSQFNPINMPPNTLSEYRSAQDKTDNLNDWIKYLIETYIPKQNVNEYNTYKYHQKNLMLRVPYGSDGTPLPRILKNAGETNIDLPGPPGPPVPHPQITSTNRLLPLRPFMNYEIRGPRADIQSVDIAGNVNPSPQYVGLDDVVRIDDTNIGGTEYPSVMPKTGYFVNYDVSPLLVLPTPLSLVPLDEGRGIHNNGIKYLPSNPASANETVNDILGAINQNPANPDKHSRGYYGAQRGEQINRSEKLYPSIGPYLFEHIDMIKNNLVRTIIQVFSDPANAQGFPAPPGAGGGIFNADAQLQHRITGAYNTIRDILVNDLKLISRPTDRINDNNNSFIYTIIGRMVDQIMRTFVGYAIEKFANRYIVSSMKTYRDEDYQTIINNITGLNIKQILQIDTGFQLNFNELLKDITDTFTRPIPAMNFDRLKYTAPIMEKEGKISKQHKLYSSTYDTTPDNSIKCYKVDLDILSILFENNSKVNSPDVSGNTPIYYAIDLLYPDLIKDLIKQGALVKNFTNQQGKSPLDYLVDLYRNQLSTGYKNESSFFVDINVFYKTMYNEIKKSLTSKEEFKNNVVVGLELAFSQLLEMYNESFYRMMITYKRNWNYEKMKKLFGLFKKYSVLSYSKEIDKGYPILMLSEGEMKEIFKKGSNLNVLTVIKESKLIGSEGIDVAKKKLEELNEYLNSLKKEKIELESMDDLSDTDRVYLANVIGRIHDIETVQMPASERKVQRLQTEVTGIEQNIDTRVDTLDAIYSVRINNFKGDNSFLSMENIYKYYEKIFDNVIEGTAIGLPHVLSGHENFGNYNQLWTNFMSSSKCSNLQNILYMMLRLQNKIMSYYGSKPLNELRDDFSIIKSFYEIIVMPYLRDYEELDQKYYSRSKNYVMNDIFNNLLHVVKYVLVPQFYLAILKSITQFIITLNPQTFKDRVDGDVIYPVFNDGTNGVSYREYIGRIMDKFVNYDNGTGPRAHLLEYLIGPFSENSTKLLLGIYESEEDMSLKTENISELFGPIISIIESNPVFPVKDDSSLIESLKNTILPYFGNVFQETIPRLKIMIDNYNRYTHNLCRVNEMMVSILYQSLDEE
jgi:hypothetical protein